MKQLNQMMNQFFYILPFFFVFTKQLTFDKIEPVINNCNCLIETNKFNIKLLLNCKQFVANFSITV